MQIRKLPHLRKVRKSNNKVRKFEDRPLLVSTTTVQSLLNFFCYRMVTILAICLWKTKYRLKLSCSSLTRTGSFFLKLLLLFHPETMGPNSFPCREKHENYVSSVCFLPVYYQMVHMEGWVSARSSGILAIEPNWLLLLILYILQGSSREWEHFSAMVNPSSVGEPQLTYGWALVAQWWCKGSGGYSPGLQGELPHHEGESSLLQNV